MKRITYMILFSLFFFLAGANLLQAQVDTVLYEQFDNGQGQWATGWVDATNATATFSIDTTGKLSGKNSYKTVVTKAQLEMYRIQRIHDLPLVAGYQYTISFMAVADSNARINCLFELAGDPYTQRLNDTASVTDAPQTFTYSMSATQSVPTNQVKLMLGGAQNVGRTIWIDSIIVTRVPDPALVSKWGETSLGYAWSVLNDSSTAPGNASMSGTQPMSSNGASLLGGFDTLKPTMDQAVVASGQLEFVGNPGESYTALRFAMSYADSLTLNNQYTDSAMWVKAAGKGYYGYEFTPRSGGTDMPNGSGGSGSIWTIINGNWSSTYSNGGGPVGPAIDQAPRLAVIEAGTYNWAISVQQINDTTDEVRWSLVKSDNSYWFGGTVMAPAVTDKFNNVAFWTKDGEHTQFNLTGVRAVLGAPITVPPAPWQAYYLDQWGETSLGYAWDVLNDTNTVIGDAGIAGTQPMASNGASLLGGFGQSINIPTDKAVIVSGQLKFVGSPGASYTALRYAITYRDSLTLNNQNTDTAMWVGSAGQGYYGYEFTPRSGGADQPNGSGGSGSIWTVNNGNWPSTYSNGGGPVGPAIDQAPRLAVIDAGTYDWAISVQQINDTTNEVRWYVVKEAAAGQQTTYWFGGTVMAPAVTNKLNNVAFWTKDGEHTEFDIIAAKIDIGAPITVPPKPFASYYVDTWGFNGSNGGWSLKPGEFVGDEIISGTSDLTGWAAVRGEFGPESGVSKDTALLVTGQLEFDGGGFDAWSSLRFGIFYSDSAGSVQVDSALDSSNVWTGTNNSTNGYLLLPLSSNTPAVSWQGISQTGTWGAVVNGTWYSTGGAEDYILGSNLQEPPNATASAGTYNFAISVAPMSATSNDVRFYLTKDDGSYSFRGKIVDNHDPLVTQKFNSINFALNTNAGTSAMKMLNVKIDRGAPLDSVLVGVEGTKSLLPTEYSLSQNYPNPFNPTTTINFALPKSSDISLVVYDILGRKVAELINGNLAAGYHSINFNASNFASGVYFYRLQAGNFVSVKKLMLLK
ncbi:MAG: T9SS type A sorting domain-containing protein [Ignavibacteriaceae bacterium]